MSSRSEPRKFDSLLLLQHRTIADAISTINNSRSQVALVVDSTLRLIGTITDGDIRRALLRGCTLEANVEEIMVREFHHLNIGATEGDALRLMLSRSIQHVPVLAADGRVAQLFLLDDLIVPKRRTNSVIIMAGGEGKRLRPLTKNLPKPMLHVGGKPILELIIANCIRAGFSEFYISVNYLKEQVMEYFGDGSEWSIRIEYLEEDNPLGTAGSLSLLPKNPEEPFLVLNGDVLTRVDYGLLLDFHNQHKPSASVCVREHITQIPYGVVHMENLNVFSFEEKPVLSHYINAGIYLLEPEMTQLVPSDKFFDMPQLLERALERKLTVCAFPIHEYWLDVGHPETLEQASTEW
jgi:dTDP-glucose pyrophosphorylase